MAIDASTPVGPIGPMRPAARTAHETPAPAARRERDDDIDENGAAAEREARSWQDRTRDFAYRKILALRERVRALKLLQRADPGSLPRAIAQLAKELAAAVKEYVEAGGRGDGSLAALPPGARDEPAPEDPRALAAYRERQLRGWAEAREAEGIADGAMVRDARGIIKGLREYLKAGLEGRDRDSPQARDAKRANREMKDTEKLLDALDGEATAARLMGKLIDRDA